MFAEACDGYMGITPEEFLYSALSRGLDELIGSLREGWAIISQTP